MVEANKPSQSESAAANRAANRAGKGNGGAAAAAVAMPIEDGAFSFDELLKQSATVCKLPMSKIILDIVNFFVNCLLTSNIIYLQVEDTNLNVIKQNQRTCTVEDLEEKYQTKNAYGYVAP